MTRVTLARALGTTLGWFAITAHQPSDGPSPPPLALAWDAPEGCPDHARVTAEVERFLGRTLAPPLGDGLTIRAHVRANGPSWEVTLLVHDGERTRERRLPSQPSCEEAMQAAALIVAIAIDPDADPGAVAADESIVPEPEPPAEQTTEIASDVSGTPATTSTDRVTAEAVVEPAEPRDAEPIPPEATNPDRDALPRPIAPPRRNRRTPLEGELGTLLAVAGGFLPGAAPELGIRGVWLWPRVQLGVETRYAFERTRERGRGRLDLSAWTVGAVIGPRFRWGTIELAPGAGFMVGVVFARPEGFARNSDYDAPWLSWRANTQLSWVPRRRLAVAVGVEAFGPILAYGFLVGQRVLYTHPWIGGRGWIAVSFRFGSRRGNPAVASTRPGAPRRR